MAARLGLNVLMLDENPNVGGQIYRAIATNPLKNQTLLGADYWRGEALAKEAASSSSQHAAGAIVWSVSPLEASGYELGVSMAGRSRMYACSISAGSWQGPGPARSWPISAPM